jgi:hypothetical protein
MSSETIQSTETTPRKKHQGRAIGGWLILVGFGVLIKPFYIILSLYPMYKEMFFSGQWEMIKTVGRMTYGPYFIPFVYMELVINILLLLFSFYLIYLFLTRDHHFPKYFIILAVGSLAFILIDAWIGGRILQEPVFDPETVREVTRAAVYAAIWVPYMLLSKRVKETFVNHK